MSVKYSNSKPFLFLDIDGVLNPNYPDRSDFHDFENLSTPWSNFMLSQTQGKIINRLQDYMQIVWATSWGDYANEYINSFYNIAHFPVIHFNPQFGEDLKSSTILEKVEDFRTPFIWVDDEIPENFAYRAKKLNIDFLLIKTDPDLGLTKNDLITIHSFAVNVKLPI